MKRSVRAIRFLSVLLLLLAVGTTLTCRTVVRRGSVPESFGVSPLTASALNAKLLRLASVDFGEAEMRKEVEDLLDGSFTSVDASMGRHRTISLWRRESGPGGRIRPPINLRAPTVYRILPEFRRSLRDWFQSRRLLSQVMPELLRLIKRPIDRHHGYPDTGRPYASCAVVGNSGILLRSEHGDLIDGHDLVIRLNNARTSGYQRHVGYKTSVSFINSNILHLCARREGCLCHPYGDFVPIVMYVCQPVHFLDYIACNASHKAPLLITDARFDALCARIVKYYSLKRFVEETGKAPEEWGKARDDRMFHYSSGMQAVMLALGICEQVSVFGFGKSAEAQHHYHTNQKAELDLHDYESEYAFYNDLVERPQDISMESMDFVLGLLKTLRKHDSIFEVVDILSKNMTGHALEYPTVKCGATVSKAGELMLQGSFKINPWFRKDQMLESYLS